MVDLTDIAARLDAEEKLSVKYRFPVRAADGDTTYQIRQDRLQDVAEDAGLIYVSHDGGTIWIRPEEVVEIIPETK